MRLFRSWDRAASALPRRRCLGRSHQKGADDALLRYPKGIYLPCQPFADEFRNRPCGVASNMSTANPLEMGEDSAAAIYSQGREGEVGPALKWVGLFVREVK